MSASSYLPASTRVPVQTLSSLLKDRTNSYKFLFFLAILEKVKGLARDYEPRSQSDNLILFDELLEEMLVLAWYPHNRFRLSFGMQDQVAEALDNVKPLGSMTHPRQQDIREVIRPKIKDPNVQKLCKYVPYRLIRPFFANECFRLPDGKVNQEILKCSRELFATRLPLYGIQVLEENNPVGIYIHNEWLAYLYDNHGIVRRWVLWEWLDYMQKCNPAVPNLASKLLPETERQPLTAMRQIFAKVLSAFPQDEILTRCIYTDEALNLSRFDIDHFLPWTFVTHNRMWNLVPIPQSLNSHKSDRVPHSDYLPRIANYHRTFAMYSRRVITKRKWENKIGEPFLSDLRLPDFDSLTDLASMERAFRTNVEPLMELAKSNGFTGDWKPGKPTDSSTSN